MKNPIFRIIIASLFLSLAFFSCKTEESGSFVPDVPDVPEAKNEVTYTITFNANDGSATPATKTQVIPAKRSQFLYSIESLGFTCRGCYFSKWVQKTADGEKYYYDGANISPTSDITLYAQWRKNYYHITFNANDGSEEPATRTQGMYAGDVNPLHDFMGS